MKKNKRTRSYSKSIHNSHKVKKDKIKREFDDFAEKIAKLESLRQELNALDTKGFEQDAKIIRVKLKDADSIPTIRKEINLLRAKIDRRNAIKHGSTGIGTRLLSQSKTIKEDTLSMKRKIGHLENLIKEKQKVSEKSKLSEKERTYIKDIPNLNAELRKLRSGFEKHTRASKVRVDSGVGVLVDSKFGDFLSEIKAELTERLKEKEANIDIQLKADMESRETMFAKRYKTLVEELHARYKDKINTDLKHDVKKKLDELLERKLNDEKRKLVEVLIRENARKLALDRKRVIEQEDANYAHKIESMKSKMQKELTVKIDEMKKDKESEVNRAIREKEKQLRESLQREYNHKLEQKKAELEAHITEQARKLLG